MRRTSSGCGGGGPGGLRQRSQEFARVSSKQYFLRRAPEVLVLHLKRFGMDSRGRLNKIDKHVGSGCTVLPCLRECARLGQGVQCLPVFVLDNGSACRQVPFSGAPVTTSTNVQGEGCTC